MTVIILYSWRPILCVTYRHYGFTGEKIIVLPLLHFLFVVIVADLSLRLCWNNVGPRWLNSKPTEPHSIVCFCHCRRLLRKSTNSNKSWIRLVLSGIGLYVAVRTRFFFVLLVALLVRERCFWQESSCFSCLIMWFSFLHQAYVSFNNWWYMNRCTSKNFCNFLKGSMRNLSSKSFIRVTT